MNVQGAGTTIVMLRVPPKKWIRLRTRLLMWFIIVKDVTGNSEGGLNI